jgi:hypothetical protein
MASKGAPEAPSGLRRGDQSIANLVSGQTAPPLTTLDTMATLKMLKDVLPPHQHYLINNVINVETQYLRTALHMLEANPALKRHFGTGVGAGMALASLVRDREAKSILDNIMKDAFEEASTKMNEGGRAGYGLTSAEVQAGLLNGGKSLFNKSYAAK